VTAILGAAAAFFPSSSIVISISNRTVSKNGFGVPATATYTIDNDGTVRNHAGTNLETWLVGVGVTSNYEVRATYSSGDALSSGTLGSWLNCGTDRSWSNSVSDDSKSTTLLVEIRDAATGTVRDNASITITANSVTL